jgi:hypothetical protein
MHEIQSRNRSFPSQKMCSDCFPLNLYDHLFLDKIPLSESDNDRPMAWSPCLNLVAKPTKIGFSKIISHWPFSSRGPIGRLESPQSTVACTLSLVASSDIMTRIDSPRGTPRFVLLISDQNHIISFWTAILSPKVFCSNLTYWPDTINFLPISNVGLPDETLMQCSCLRYQYIRGSKAERLRYDLHDLYERKKENDEIRCCDLLPLNLLDTLWCDWLFWVQSYDRNSLNNWELKGSDSGSRNVMLNVSCNFAEMISTGIYPETLPESLEFWFKVAG